jgi:phosphoenolpyruvate-protein phosphotransferase
MTRPGRQACSPAAQDKPKDFLMDTSALTQELVLTAPLSGMLLPLSAVPDPVFAQKMIGDGIAILPCSNVLRAPCNGTIATLHSARHALTLRSERGVEILLHIGLDTVELKGQGFDCRVAPGERIVRGDALIEFDPLFLDAASRSLITPVVILNGDPLARLHAASGQVIAGRDRILTLSRAETSDEPDPQGGQHRCAESAPITLLSPSGLHARPAALLAQAAKKFQAHIYLHRGAQRANAKSVVALLGLNAQHGDIVRIEAQGGDAHSAILQLSPLAAGTADDGHSLPCHADKPPPDSRPSADPECLRGIGASPGMAHGQIHSLHVSALNCMATGNGTRHERQTLSRALTAAHAQLQELAKASPGEHGAIFSAHQALLDDPLLHEQAGAAIARGQSAAFAWQQACEQYAAELERVPNTLLSARAADLRDVARRVLQLLLGLPSDTVDLPADSILIAEELSPSQTATLDRNRVRGICTRAGGASSHAAILARALGIPAVLGIEHLALSIPNGTPAIIDGQRGTLRLHPGQEELRALHAQQQQLAQQNALDLASAAQPACTLDGRRVHVVANIGSLAEARECLTQGAEGVGLLRSEFLFLQRSAAPDEAEQAASYIEIARALGPARALVLRTLDVGGDKPLAYLPLAAEANPFLGVRGVRLSLAQPEMFSSQLRAMLQAAPYTRLRIMFPMIATLDELRQCKQLLAQQRPADAPPVQVGIMIEVPSAAIMAEKFAREADFFSIGSNDLSQYVLAMDRNHPQLGRRADALDPAVLHLMAGAVRAAHAHGRQIGLCGALASDLQALPLLLGLEIDELSVSVPAIAAVKARIRQLSQSQCRQLADEALQQSGAAQVRACLARAGMH